MVGFFRIIHSASPFLLLLPGNLYAHLLALITARFLSQGLIVRLFMAVPDVCQQLPVQADRTAFLL